MTSPRHYGTARPSRTANDCRLQRAATLADETLPRLSHAPKRERESPAATAATLSVAAVDEGAYAPDGGVFFPAPRGVGSHHADNVFHLHP